MSNEISFEVDSLCIPFARERFGKYTLMENQKNLMDSTSRVIIIDSPTSSGKTLGILSKFFSFGDINGFIVYPTNELIDDQLQSIKQYIENIGKKVKINEYEHNPGYIGVFSVDGPDLDSMLEEYKLNAKGSLLNRLFNLRYKRKIILTNPDAIFLLSRAEYKYGIQLFRDLKRNNFRFLALDEFHMYSGVSLANFMVSFTIFGKIIDQLIISTATPPEPKIIGILKKIVGGGHERVPYQMEHGENCSENYRIIRHKTRVRLRIIPSKAKILIGPKDINQILKDTEELYYKYKNDSCEVKVLIIVNSVIFAAELWGRLKERFGEKNVGAVFGLLPKSERKIRDITIGTSAIEVGIDFKTCALIFEATNASSFIQRFGRVSRHMPGEAIGYLCKWDYDVLSRELSNEVHVSYQKLKNVIDRYMDPLRNYADFIESRDFFYFITAYIWRLTGYLLKQRKISKENRVKQYEKALELFSCFKVDSRLVEAIKLVLRNKNHPRYRIIRALEKILFRGSNLYLPAIYNGEIITIGIQDLNKVKISTLDIKKIKFIGLSQQKIRKLKYLAMNNGVDVILKIENIGQNNNIRLWIPQTTKRKKLIILDKKNFGVETNNSKLSRSIKKVLIGELAYITDNKFDWRFTSFKYRGEYIIIGADAILAKWIEKSKNGLF